jgi:ion channel-forming bestrophin family protein
VASRGAAVIIRQLLRPHRVWTYVKREVLTVTLMSAFVAALYSFASVDTAIPFVPLGLLGTALAITMGFRNQTAYARWWEARTAWGSIVNVSRQYARLVRTFTDSHRHHDAYRPELAQTFISRMIRRQISWCHALRCQLRQQALDDDVQRYLDAEEWTEISQHHNPANTLLTISGRDIYEAMSQQVLQGFDSFQLEGCLAQLQAAQGTCERIKNTPLLRQFAYFTTVFLWAFLLLTPFAVASLWSTPTGRWLGIPLSAILAFVFTIVDKAGRVTEDPFANAIQDVPMSAITRTIERDLLDTIGDQTLPPSHEAIDGYLL